jgi:acetyl-CoA carboxylase carboxyl transferase subunit alpha
MARYYLDFEKPIEKLEEQILKLQSVEDDQDLSAELVELIDRRDNKLREIYSNLNRWQRVQLARHPERPFSLDYIEAITTEFVELHGDRNFADDTALVGGIGKIDDQSVVLIGQQKVKHNSLFINFSNSPIQCCIICKITIPVQLNKFCRDRLDIIQTEGTFRMASQLYTLPTI